MELQIKIEKSMAEYDRYIELVCPEEERSEITKEMWDEWEKINISGVKIADATKKKIVSKLAGEAHEELKKLQDVQMELIETEKKFLRRKETRRKLWEEFEEFVKMAGESGLIQDMPTPRQIPTATALPLQQSQQIQHPVPVAAIPAPLSPMTPSHAEKIQLLSQKSRLKPEYAKMCLETSNWDLAASWETFMSVKVWLAP